MRLRNRPRDRESEPKTVLAIRAAGPIAAIKRLKHVAFLRVGNARPVIAHVDIDGVILRRAKRDRHEFPVLEAVLDQIDDCPRELIGVSVHVDVCTSLERDFATRIGAIIAHGLDQTRQIDPDVRASSRLVAEKRQRRMKHGLHGLPVPNDLLSECPLHANAAV
jgi:hypothetical protein